MFRFQSSNKGRFTDRDGANLAKKFTRMGGSSLVDHLESSADFKMLLEDVYNLFSKIDMSFVDRGVDFGLDLGSIDLYDVNTKTYSVWFSCRLGGSFERDIMGLKKGLGTLMWSVSGVDTVWVIPSSIEYENGLLIIEVGFKA